MALWRLDNGCNTILTNNIKHLHDIKLIEKQTGNGVGGNFEIIAKGRMKIKNIGDKEGQNVSVNAYYAPSLRAPLMGIGDLASQPITQQQTQYHSKCDAPFIITVRTLRIVVRDLPTQHPLDGSLDLRGSLNDKTC